MDSKAREEKIAIIEKQLKALLCFSIEECEEYLIQIRFFAEEGLDAFLGFLAEAKNEQDKFFTATLKRSPEFALDFSRFLNQTADQIKDRFEADQKNEAEKILSDFTST